MASRQDWRITHPAEKDIDSEVGLVLLWKFLVYQDILLHGNFIISHLSFATIY